MAPINPFGAFASLVPSAPSAPVNPLAPLQPLISQVSSGLLGTPLPVLAPAVPLSLIPLRSAIGAIDSSSTRSSTSTARAGGFGAFAVGDEAATTLDATSVSPIIALPTTDTTASEEATDSLTTTSTTTETATETATLDAVADTTLPIEELPTGIALAIGSNPYVGPYDPNSVYDPNSPYYDPYAQPAGWEGTDAGNYDGEDDYYYYQGKPVKRPGYGHDDDHDEECPAWCLEDDSYDSYDSYYPYPTSDSKYSPYKPEPTAKYPSYSSVADPYPEYKKTPEYDPYPQKTTYKEETYPSATPYVEEPQYYPEPEPDYPQLKKVRSILRAVRRQVYNWGQPTYSDDDDEGQYDGEDGSIPDWLYDLDNAPKKPAPTPKPTCPKSCYKHKTDDYGYGTKPARPTYTKTRKGGYQTTADPYYTSEDPYYTSKDPYQTTKAPYGQGNGTTLYGPTSVPDDSTSVPDETTSIPDEPTSVPDEPTSVPDEPTSVPDDTATAGGEPGKAYYEPTTLVTQYQPQPYPEETGYPSSDPGSPAGDYTGETLDTICPNTCNPFNPAENFCDITTGCTTTGGSKYYCACRAGFRADDFNAKDFSKQFKVAGQPYVYLAVHTTCNTPCSDQTCSEVLERTQCK